LVCERDRRHGLEQGPNQNLQVKTGSVEIFPVVVVFLANPARAGKRIKRGKRKAYGVVSTTEQWRGNVKSFRRTDTRKTTDVETIDKNDAATTVAPSGRRDECVGGLSRNAQRSFC
jgi:hypothetical protein